MDDESYFPADLSQVPGVKFYHTSDKTAINKQLTIKNVEKYSSKFLVWQAISSDGNRSKPFITTGQAMNGKLYLQQCIQARLLPFIDQYYQCQNVLFWPDLATAHYQKDVLATLHQNGITVVPRNKNPPNLPQARPIERYWCLVKQVYQQRKKSANALNSFKRMYATDSRKVSHDTVRGLMDNVPKILRSIRYKGAYSQS